MVSLVPIFHGRIDMAARLHLEETERDRRRVHLQALVGRRVEILIRKERVQRSVDQNAYLHAVPFPLLAAHFGDSIEGVKYDLMGEKWGLKPSAVDPARLVPVKPSTASMTVEECTEFIDWLIPWALTEHGVSIPLPHEVAA